jgi:hypothetical protein
LALRASLSAFRIEDFWMSGIAGGRHMMGSSLPSFSRNRGFMGGRRGGVSVCSGLAGYLVL